MASGPSPTQPRIWECRALTDIWTGDANGKPDRLITTGLLGSIRWWFEVLVRGLGGSACDPTNTKCQDRMTHCVVCELFGCTGWARKFRFDVLDGKGDIQARQITKGAPFSLRFTPLRQMKPEEWALLDATIRLISEYGAIGGRTVLKPSDEDDRKEKPHHQGLGLVEILRQPEIEAASEDALRTHMQGWRHVTAEPFVWASLEYFWFVGGRRYLARQSQKKSTFNAVLGRNPDKSVKEKKGRRIVRWSDLPPSRSDDPSNWLGGGRGISKKVFSFKDPPRTFGFVKPGLITFADMRGRLRSAWSDFDAKELVEGRTILKRLLDDSTPRPA